MKKIITSESVNCGHPDKTCDIIADSFLDAALAQDPNSQMAVECAIKNNKLFIYGEATTTANINYKQVAKEVLAQIGYNAEQFEFITELSVQSPDISQAVHQPVLAANDQGMMYGYATNETPEYMPLPILLAHKLMRQYETFRQATNNFFADAKAQVSVEYDGDTIVRIDTVLLSVSHASDITHTQIEAIITNNVLTPVLSAYAHLLHNVRYIINPSGKFTIWGSHGDSGCVGRKIVVDTYGGVGRVGGGCFSSKNATKVDRSGAYYARYAAKNIVAHGLANKCEIQVAYAIGIAKPVSIYVDCFGTQQVSLEQIDNFVATHFDFSLANMIAELNLLKPQYKQTACYGHFGRDGFAWEQIKQINY